MVVFSFIDDDDEVMASSPTTPVTVGVGVGVGGGGGGASPLRESTDSSNNARENEKQQQQSRLATKKVMFGGQGGEHKLHNTSSSAKRKRQGTPVPYNPYFMSTLAETEDSLQADDGDDEILQAADDAFHELQIMDATAREDKKRHAETDDFPDEGLPLSKEKGEPSSPASSRFRMRPEDILMASNSTKTTVSIMDRLTKSVVGSKTTNSNTDYGRRMGRSFRVGWGPDGTFLSIDSTTGRIITRSRPVFSSSRTPEGNRNQETGTNVRSSSSSSNVNIAGLETQIKRSMQVPSKKTVDGCPLHTIDLRTPRGRRAQAEPLEKTLMELAGSSPDAESRDAFKLLNVMLQKFLLTPQSPTSASIKDHLPRRRIIAAITQWLVDSTSDDVGMELSKYHSNHDPVSMILSALSGGDVRMASSLAEQNGYNELSVLLTSSSSCPEGKEDIKRELHNSTSDDVGMELSKYHSNHDPVSMILSALSGGDVRMASSLAEQNGYNELAVLLTSSSSCPEGKENIKRELHEWSLNGVSRKIPTKLLRAYHMIAGNESLEDTAYQRNESGTPFDWRRRMLIDLVYSSSSDDKDLSDLLQDYEVKITGQQAPFPVPRYLWDQDTQVSSKKIESVLYKLLQLGAESPSLDPATIFDPLGYGSNPHDFGLAFGLTTCMTALNSVVGRPSTAAACLDKMKSRELVDGYVANLIAVGHWDMAVWASIHLFTLDPSFVKVQSQLAKSLVLKHFNGDAETKNFLDSIGIPPAWLNEAEAYRSGIAGDFFAYTSSIAKVNVQKAREAMESNIVPDIIFMDNDQCSDFLSTLESISGSDRSLSKAVLDLFDINKTIKSLDGCTANQLKEELTVLKEACNDIESTLTKVKFSLRYLKQFPQISPCSRTDTVDMKYFVSEALRDVTLFRLQLLALENQKSIHGSLSELLVLRSNLTTKDGISGGMSNMDIDSSASLRAFL
eukprot:CAMPEP_0113464782 /NCGR_PEP_ID=MMETSP0014_2-20120614/13382_1 /TAXON_ID=2857 /ORGANISM="Nitzschia sp." /LENGTH=958 /DNA_ID=CAMNT_0000356881 /DNA_START=58 /DNA_END=2934 /DNA_ORIENTATION=- /assembly_acc=CAM_ASM_000159